ncbi:hypothetical protein [Ruminococcus sp.]|uniref:hypothetical protein n=1 Tax=Ruminococcus sp. TaxID=41978 RepID=UPI00262227A0|nr:hypothetical protein [Ruminococcus sp.]MDD6988470.1 hypothetical protein [Ruminococcus sp.]MDY6200783.1 hypothetical protein [Ruminococcus sp.]
MKFITKKFLFKSLSVALSIVFLFCSILLVYANDNRPNEEKDLQAVQFESTQQNNNILNYFENNIIKSRQNYDRINIELSYPDYYGGSYLDENGELIILLKNGNENIRNNLKTVSLNEELQFEQADFSYAELTEIINFIMSYQENNYDNNSKGEYNIAKDIVDCTLDDKNNKIIVGIRNLTSDKIDVFKNQILDSSAIEFVERTYTPKSFGQNNYSSNNSNIDTTAIVNNARSLVTVRPGMELFMSNKNGNMTYSLGIPMYRTITSGKQYGFVTAGHELAVNDFFTDLSTSTRVGTVKLNRVGGKYDVSFVALESGVTCSDNIKDTPYSLYPSNEELTKPVNGKLVYAYGAKTYTSGKITTTNYSYYNEKLKTSFSGMIGANYFSKPGDSGGLVASSGSDNYTKIQEGITCGGQYDNNDNLVGTYYCSVGNIVNLWYLVCY